MKNLISPLTLALILFANTVIHAQSNYSEKTIPLSKSASKGYLYDFDVSETGAMQVVFKYSDKKKELFETYSIDKDLAQVNQKTEETAKDRSIVKEDYTKSMIYANIGGSNSFDVLSSKLKLSKAEFSYTWNKDKQKYYSKQTKYEKITLKNVDDRAYAGYADFGNKSNGELMVLTAIENKKEKTFYLLNVKQDLSIKEIALPLEGKQTLAYSCAVQKGSGTEDEDEFDISNADMLFIFAPAEKSPDLQKYTFIRLDNKGTITDQFTFTSPSPNLLITESKLIPNGNIILFGAYTKSKDAFEEVFGEYGPIISPGYLATDVTGSQNYRMFKYNKHAENEKMQAMVVMNMKKGGIEWMRDIPVKNMEAMLKKAPEQKKAPVYNGKAFKIQQFEIIPNGDMLVSGQLKSWISLGLGNPMKAYKELICFHFDKDGNLKAQYGYEPESIDDKQNVIYPIQQAFIPSADGNTINWVILENKTEKGYESFMDAFNGNSSLYPVYYPSVIKINSAAASISNLEELGKRNFRLNRRYTYHYSKANNSLTFIGRDKGNKNLWLCNYKI
jgi:hypothetical protein